MTNPQHIRIGSCRTSFPHDDHRRATPAQFGIRSSRGISPVVAVVARVQDGLLTHELSQEGASEPPVGVSRTGGFHSLLLQSQLLHEGFWWIEGGRVVHGLLFHQHAWDMWCVSQSPLDWTETTNVWGPVDS